MVVQKNTHDLLAFCNKNYTRDLLAFCYKLNFSHPGGLPGLLDVVSGDDDGGIGLLGHTYQMLPNAGTGMRKKLKQMQNTVS